MGRSVSCSDRFNGQANGDEVIFSFVDGFVWLSWPGAVSKVRVGGYENVTTAMRVLGAVPTCRAAGERGIQARFWSILLDARSLFDGDTPVLRAVADCLLWTRIGHCGAGLDGRLTPPS
jgi:hypothetical protein